MPIVDFQQTSEHEVMCLDGTTVDLYDGLQIAHKGSGTLSMCQSAQLKGISLAYGTAHPRMKLQPLSHVTMLKLQHILYGQSADHHIQLWWYRSSTKLHPPHTTPKY